MEKQEDEKNAIQMISWNLNGSKYICHIEKKLPYKERNVNFVRVSEREFIEILSAMNHFIKK
jgi:hypothetical protein